MLQNTIDKFNYLLTIIPAKLAALSEAEMTKRPAPDKWSKKEILGHLIDSATNNHQRFIRIQFQDTPYIVYDQNQWVDCNGYQYLNTKHIIGFWELYNRHLLYVIQHIPEDRLQRTCLTNTDTPVTLGWLIDDYVVHMEHHLHQLVSYE